MEDTEYGNDAAVEATWAASAFGFAERHWLLLQHKDPRVLKLTSSDSEIYAAFREAFPDLPVDTIHEDSMKSPEGKARWRDFLENVMKPRVSDYSFGTLLRVKYDAGYDSENTILVTRGHFYAIEAARNRELPRVPQP
mmetsp:Transcript_13721/g.33846  ORF Transcript_13721/g.33846 Transcript_13721/m.33846 type:complete len:138 (+) Transcript_13721:102-515(+)|eukprot:CAMPEP_0198363526 /NCGR_PEP_ID=MMETSP1450-20131203/150108_1 /TAXON_ID=753684 ORGANISM="Madagascaria erythrocladiodes, Strain CCMP3234" /NCGR_SAMPLE_ID=MMETSP1450 /ASSEMBLY_ACC=CAM_ASM_001115 /LENGTH=137 /DNA_ID=CAMNT_0044070869 /DNA_START=87 /DNA_END=500 /DNA_ORIENTATION=-